MQAWQEAEPGADPWVQIRQALASVHGVDKNPFAVVISRFRLLMAAIKVGGAERLAEVPELPLIVAVGDSLIPRETAGNSWPHPLDEDLSDFEDPAINLLGQGSYDAVVGNPPYIVVRDRHEYEIYRAIYPVCRGKYPLTVPFVARFFQLARSADGRAGFTGLLVSNAFMKREFGRPLVEEFLTSVDLTHVLDTSGAYIPGHGVPTVILLGRARPPTARVVRTALSVRGEPTQPADPAAGVVWQAITRQIDDPGSESEWVVVSDIDRERFAAHPWSLAGSRANDLLTAMETGTRLSSQTARIGYYAITGSDDAFTAPPAVFRRIGAEDEPTITVITGSEVRDWAVTPRARAFFPGEDAEHPIDITRFPGHMRRLWPCRTTLRNRRYLGAQLGAADSRAWYRWHHVTKTAGAHPWSLTFPWVATHPHFVLLRGDVAALQSAPVVKLPAAASEDDFFQLLAVLNSSAACFWLKQYSQSKGAPRADQLRAEEAWEHFYEFTSSRLEELPLPGRLSGDHGRALDELARRLASVRPAALCAREVPTRAGLDAARMRARADPRADDRAAGGTGLGCLPTVRAAQPGRVRSADRRAGQPSRAEAGRARVRDRAGAAGAARRGRDPVVRPAPLHADHGDPGGLASGVPRCRGEAHRDDRAPPEHRPDRAARVQTPLAKRAVGDRWSGKRSRTGCWTGARSGRCGTGRTGSRGR